MFIYLFIIYLFIYYLFIHFTKFHFFFWPDLDPCIDVTCHYHCLCKAFGSHDARCVAEESCPSYQEPVCSSNGTTYDNECLFRQEMCLIRLNFSVQSAKVAKNNFNSESNSISKTKTKTERNKKNRTRTTRSTRAEQHKQWQQEQQSKQRHNNTFINNSKKTITTSETKLLNRLGILVVPISRY